MTAPQDSQSVRWMYLDLSRTAYCQVAKEEHSTCALLVCAERVGGTVYTLGTEGMRDTSPPAPPLSPVHAAGILSVVKPLTDAPHPHLSPPSLPLPAAPRPTLPSEGLPRPSWLGADGGGGGGGGRGATSSAGQGRVVPASRHGGGTGPAATTLQHNPAAGEDVGVGAGIGGPWGQGVGKRPLPQASPHRQSQQQLSEQLLQKWQQQQQLQGPGGACSVPA